MRTTALAMVAAGVVAACQYSGRPTDEIDADPSRPDADPSRPDADPSLPDAEEPADAAPAPDASSAACPASYVALGTSHYRWVPGATTWLAAELDCEDDATPTGVTISHLAVVDDATERQRLISGSGTTLDHQWVGLTDLAAEGTTIYITAQTTVDSPAGITGNTAGKDCARVSMAGDYSSRDCTESNIYVCECDGVPADPARFPNYPDGN